jgi:(p)ppGpp synthase/HD superfamily hydrolase
MQLSKLASALDLAIQAHQGQVRKSTTIPYISHPMAVASIALEFGATED